MKLSRALIPFTAFLVTPIGVSTALLVASFALPLVDRAAAPFACVGS